MESAILERKEYGQKDEDHLSGRQDTRYLATSIQVNRRHCLWALLFCYQIIVNKY